MIRYYCDICGDEIIKPQSQFMYEVGRLRVQVQRAIDGTWNGGQACERCVIAAIKGEQAAVDTLKFPPSRGGSSDSEDACTDGFDCPVRGHFHA